MYDETTYTISLTTAEGKSSGTTSQVTLTLIVENKGGKKHILNTDPLKSGETRKFSLEDNNILFPPTHVEVGLIPTGKSQDWLPKEVSKIKFYLLL